ncbi:putative 2'-5'-oligoadenylate synthase 3-like [Apostichopus japonicus]|uniref:Putative 2'-5'-oligoadenylate synthase 3-like n=1 Tax=Stichopus japonicus TaxID=307972 RepID=A0A2G8KYX2_STIJA|nr:putative 2'-5'-oligoadenylate synthase 3-like [Apostichopus japonicus]
MSSDLCSALKEFADNLAPPQSLVNEVGRIIDRLSRHLHSDRFKWKRFINRIVPLGSYAKKSSLRIMMDLDLVVYLNDCEYPFEDFVRDLEEHIELSDSYTNCTLNGTCLFFVAEKTLHVDLLPATNRVPRNELSRGKSAQEVQQEMTLAYILNSSNSFDEGRKQSTGLSETAVEFVKRKNQVFHCSTLARLAKFWSKTVCVEGFHSGRSSIMEYIAIRSTEIEQNTGRENTLKAFRRFLTIVSNPEEMAIYWTEYYKIGDIKPRMKNSRPLLLDPTNPYNNILRGKNKSFMVEMANFARVSMDRLEEADCRALRGESVDLQSLFKPQPEWMQLPFNLRRRSQPKNFYVSVRDGGAHGLTMPKTVTKKSMEESDRDIIENFLFSFSEVAVAGSKKKGIPNVAQKVQTDVQHMIAPGTSWGPGGSISNRDAKLEIPFTDEKGIPKVLDVGFDL